MWKPWIYVFLALVGMCVHVATSEVDELCVNVSVGHKTANESQFIYPLQAGIENFKINIPTCVGSERAGVSASVCDARSSTSIQLDNMDYAFIRRSGDINEPGRADVVVYCEWNAYYDEDTF